MVFQHIELVDLQIAQRVEEYYSENTNIPGKQYIKVETFLDLKIPPENISYWQIQSFCSVSESALETSVKPWLAA